MSKIYDALELARKARIISDASKEPAAPPLPVNLGPGASDGEVNMEQEMIILYQTITAALPGVEHRSVLFVGSRSNEGTSTLARQLAKAVSLRMEKSVLLIDFDRSRPDLHVYENLQHEYGSASKDSAIEMSLCRVEETSLYVLPLFQRTMATPKTLDSAKENVFWQPLKDRFDFIIVDSPPATMFPDGMALSSQVDGVILVVQAEKTKWQVAQNVKEKIEKHGGKILGIVFNRRRFYIPEWLYKRL